EPARLGEDRPFQPLLATVHRARPGALAAARRLGDAPVHGQVLELETVHAVIGGQHRQAELLGHPGAEPLIPAATQGGRRTGVIGNAAIAAAEHQDLDELVEHQPVSDAGPVAASGWGTWRVGSRAATWTHNGSRMDDGRAGTRPPDEDRGGGVGDDHGSARPCSTSPYWRRRSSPA